MPTASTLVAAALSGLLATGSGGGAELVLRLHDPALVESSGLAVSARHDGVLWTNPDGGEVAQVMAVDGSGDTVATVTLDGIDPYDPEALAPGPDGRSLWLGDLGDNLEQRPDVSVFRFTEPRRLADRTVRARWYRFTYPDGPHDAEALLVDPSTGRLLVATKALGGAGLYRAPARLVAEGEGTNRLQRVADVPSLVTDGAFLPDGRFVLRSYTMAYVYDRPGHQVASAPLPRQPQGESVADDWTRLAARRQRGRGLSRLPGPGPRRRGGPVDAGRDVVGGRRRGLGRVGPGPSGRGRRLVAGQPGGPGGGGGNRLGRHRRAPAPSPPLTSPSAALTPLGRLTLDHRPPRVVEPGAFCARTGPNSHHSAGV